ncbi:Uncharacterised protein [Mycobacteroides abscessus subsp. abscessus]|nr:Uncharacterised protein [Mycobacteroides abscessus subsp. abscessus]
MYGGQALLGGALPERRRPRQRGLERLVQQFGGHSTFDERMCRIRKCYMLTVDGDRHLNVSSLFGAGPAMARAVFVGLAGIGSMGIEHEVLDAELAGQEFAGTAR